jgi:hypothetical protein
LSAERASGCCSNAAVKLSRDGCRGSQVGSTDPSSCGALRAVEISQNSGNARKTR